VLLEMLMKHQFLFVVIVLLTVKLSAQNQKKIQRSWIKTSIENLSNTPIEPDTLYTRYTFEKSSLNISFYPGWDDYKQTWSVNNDNVTIGFDTYKIETLTDTTLTISLDGFRRLKFVVEESLTNQKGNLDSIGVYNGKPLYKANQFVNPRFIGKGVFRNIIQKNTEGYNIKKASYFLATFIVNVEGKVENVKIVRGITEGFDNEIAKQLTKTSKDWRPAYFQGKPIQTEMSYEIKYLNSLTPYNSGNLN
jgi:hypothetical protein